MINDIKKYCIILFVALILSLMGTALTVCNKWIKQEDCSVKNNGQSLPIWCK